MYNACLRVCLCARECRRDPAGESRAWAAVWASNIRTFFFLRKVSLLEASHRADAQGAAELCTNSLLIFQVVGPPLVTAGASSRWAGWRMFSKVSALSYLLYKVTIFEGLLRNRGGCHVPGGGAVWDASQSPCPPPLVPSSHTQRLSSPLSRY
jgi:hypothetical protein